MARIHVRRCFLYQKTTMMKTRETACSMKDTLVIEDKDFYVVREW
jgi:hypothetical protein